MKIIQVVGVEPMREGEYPNQLWVGYPHFKLGDKITRIECEEQNLGTYGISWFVGYREDGSVVAKMNAAHVEYVRYETTDVQA
jgi:hypothetical protein